MTILFVNNEASANVTGVAAGGSTDCRSNTATSGYDANYGRYAQETAAGSVGRWPMIATPTWDTVDSYWFHIYLRAISNASTRFYVRADDNSIIYQIYFTGGSTSTRVEVYSYDDAQATTSVSHTLTLNTNYNFSFKFDRIANELVIYDGASVRATLALDVNRRTNNPTLGDITMTAATTVRYWSEFFAAVNEDTTLWRVKTLYPNAAGTFADWVGAYTEVDDSGLDTATLNTISAQGTQTYGFTDVQAGIMTDREIGAISITAVGDATAGTNTNLKNVYYDGSTLRDLGSVQDQAGLAYVNGNTATLLNDPKTNARWVYTDLNSYEFGFATEAGTDSEVRVTKQSIGVLITPLRAPDPTPGGGSKRRARAFMF